MPKPCDNKSSGVVLENLAGEYLLIDRARPPYGLAGVAGHQDEHGDELTAAHVEVFEEVGIILPRGALTEVHSERIYNPCRRPGGDYHDWTVFRGVIEDTAITRSQDETKSAGWYSRDKLQAIADRTMLGEVQPTAEVDNKVFEDVWLRFFGILDIVKVR